MTDFNQQDKSKTHRETLTLGEIKYSLNQVGKNLHALAENATTSPAVAFRLRDEISQIERLVFHISNHTNESDPSK